MAIEARTMEYARANGYPVPGVDRVSDDGTELVMERVTGPLLITTMMRPPWPVRRGGTILAELHRRLHRIAAPDWVADVPDDGGSLLHLDLHPLNVIVSPTGPVVIDWPNAARGSGEVDVALTWALLACGQIPSRGIAHAVGNRLRTRLVRSFLSPFDRAAVSDVLRRVAEWKAADPNLSPSEQAALLDLAQQVGRGA